MKPVISIVTLRVENWPGMLAYYRDVVGLVPKLVDEESQYAMFDTGAVRFAIEGRNSPTYEDGAGKLVVNFQVENLTASVEDLARNGGEAIGLIKRGPAYDYAVMSDPEGNEHILYERRKS